MLYQWNPVLSEDGSQMIFFIALSVAVEEGRRPYHKGVAYNPGANQICVGTSEGDINIVTTENDCLNLLGPSKSVDNTSSVSDLCFSTATSQLVSVHDGGEIFYWTPDDTGKYQHIHSEMSQPGEVPTRCVTFATSLIVSFGHGVIRVWDMLAKDLRVEICAHARWISSMDGLPDKGIFASVGEDTVLNVWKVEEGTHEISLLHTSVVADKLLCGVAFTDPISERLPIACVAYDTDQVFASS